MESNIMHYCRSCVKLGKRAYVVFADHGISLAYEAEKLFPDAKDGPDFVWYAVSSSWHTTHQEFSVCVSSVDYIPVPVSGVRAPSGSDVVHWVRGGAADEAC